ncbi:hypothetical protein KCU90_g143, partial [Aureobasidium melanogenum]
MCLVLTWFSLSGSHMAAYLILLKRSHIGNDKTSLALAVVFAKKLRHCRGLHMVEDSESMTEDVSACDCIDSTIPVFPVVRISKKIGSLSKQIQHADNASTRNLNRP